MSETGDAWNDDPPTQARGGLLRGTVRKAVLVVVASFVMVQFLNKGPGFWDRIAITLRTTVPEEAGPAPGQGESDLVEGRALSVRAGAGGHFWVSATVDGVKLRFVVDTGATTVTLRPDDALRLGLNPASLDFSESYRTANGVVRGAPVTLRSLRIGALSREDVRATVSEAPMSVSLLGMSFLNRLRSYEVKDNRLILRW
ncbi:MAG: TIGR02281 family clan AA aspartic protease [Alphaproteobacteria bacterium]